MLRFSLYGHRAEGKGSKWRAADLRNAKDLRDEVLEKDGLYRWGERSWLHEFNLFIMFILLFGAEAGSSRFAVAFDATIVGFGALPDLNSVIGVVFNLRVVD